VITARVRCVHFRGNDRVDILDKKEVDKGIIGNIEFAIEYLKDRVAVEYEIKKLARVEKASYPESAYREAIVNAVIHFDYFDGGGIAVEKLKDQIIINNTGELLFNAKEFGRKSEARNRLLADLLARTKYMEKVGTGIRRIKKACKRNHNLVKFSFLSSFWVEFYSNKYYSNVGIGVGLDDGLNDGLKLLLDLIIQNPNITAKECTEKLNKSDKTIERHIKQLVDMNLIERKGSKKTGGYFLKSKEDKNDGLNSINDGLNDGLNS